MANAMTLYCFSRLLNFTPLRSTHHRRAGLYCCGKVFVLLLKKKRSAQFFINCGMRQGIKHTIKTNGSYYMTMTVVGWPDVFTRKNHKQAIVDSLRYCIGQKGLNVYAYCIMTNHLHLIANCDEPFQLKDTVRDFKRHSARTVLDQILNEPKSRRENLVSIFKNTAQTIQKARLSNFGKRATMPLSCTSKNFYRIRSITSITIRFSRIFFQNLSIGYIPRHCTIWRKNLFYQRLQ